MSQQAQVFLLRGGVDRVTPAAAIDPGRCIAALNYEATERGYRRRDGFERFDGRPSPSDATFVFIPLTSIGTAPDEGDMLEGGTSGATGTVIAFEQTVVSTDATFDSTDVTFDDIDLTMDATTGLEVAESGYVVVIPVSGTFQAGEVLDVAGVVVGTSGAPAQNSAPTVDLYDEWIEIAQEARRTLIGAPSGSGQVWGVHVYKDEVYAFRNNSGETASLMWKSTTAGWVAQDLGFTIAFTAGGTVAPSEGQTLTRSGVTSTVRRIVLTGGTWGAGTAAGYFVISGASGTYTSSAATAGSTNLTLSGAQTANSLPVITGGRGYRLVNYSFSGARGDERMYGCNGTGPAFEWDGTYFTPIRTPLSTTLDKPLFPAVFQNHLFLFFRGGSMLNSEIGNPLHWTTTGGGGEIVLGSFPRDAIEAADTALIVICRTKILYLTGTSTANFVMKELSSEAGGWAGTAQNVGGPIYTDQRGIRTLAQAETFAGFRMGTVTQDISDVFTSLVRSERLPSASMRSTTKDQYRLYFSDGYGITVYFGRKRPEITFTQLPVSPTCAVSSVADETAVFANSERLFIGTADGWVYEMDKGTSDDGAEIEALLRLPFNMVDSPAYDKRFHSVDLEADTLGRATLAVITEFDFAAGNRASGTSSATDVWGGGGFWNEVNWNEFTWSAPTNGQFNTRIDGVGQSCCIAVLSRATYEQPHTLTTARINWSPRKYRR